MKIRQIAILTVLLSLAFVTLLTRTAFFGMYEAKTVDSRFSWRYRLRGPSPSPEIALIGIDDQTLRALGGCWPISWRWHALLLEALSEKLPAVVAYDVLFLPGSGQDKSDEEKLVEATRRLGDTVYPYYFDLEEGSAAPPASGDGGPPDELLRRGALGVVEGDLSSLPRTVEVTLPLRPLAARAALGFANAQGDAEDGVMRRVPLVLRFKNSVYPSFCLMAALRYHNVEPARVRVLLGRRVEFDVPGGPPVSIPIDARGMMRVNYTARDSEFSRSVFSQVLQSFALQEKGAHAPVNLSDFEGKLVLVGVTATGVIESYTKPTPLSPESPLLTVYANAIGTILSRSFLREPAPRTAVAILLLLGALAGVISCSFRAGASLGLSLLCLAVYLAASYAAFFALAVILPVVPGLMMVVFVYTLITSYRYATEERQRRFYRGVLGKYLSRNVMEEILRNPAELKLGGARRELTVMFADVKGFTAFCEKSEVEDIAPRLNELHDRMTRIIWKHDGTLDKYIGDAVMAFWGAPLPQEDHARRAVLAAIDMRDELRRMGADARARGVDSFAMGIGINTGTMVVGNMGSNEFWDYTVLGDEVNLGARIEALTRGYGVDIVISESTRRMVQDVVETRLLGEVTVKGKEKTVVVHELIGRAAGRNDGH
ncbi:MAG: adenylate/guanylate cyclase domain-containing protein [Chlamydiota bacterium]